MFSSKN